MSLSGIRCPYGSECLACNSSLKTNPKTNNHEISNNNGNSNYNENNNENNNGNNNENRSDGNNTYITTSDIYRLLKILPNNHDLTYEYINDFDNWLSEQKQLSTIETKKYNDNDYDLFIISTTKACPTCGFRSTHFHSHQCHHIS